jgi:hypothetical protein
MQPRNFVPMKRVCCIFWLSLITFFSAANSFSVFEENGKVGLKDSQGHVIIPAQYDALGWSDGRFSVVDNVTGFLHNNRWGLINVSNHRVTKAEYDDLIPGEGSLLVARKKSNLSLRIVTGCINTSGKEIIPFQYDGIKLLSLRAIVFTKIGNQFKYGLIDLENKTLIPQQYQTIHSIGSLRFAVENFENKMALFTDLGRQITDFTIDSLSSFKKNYAVLYQNLRQGVIDREGQIKVEPKFRSVIIRDDGVIKVREMDEWLFLDGQNKSIQKTTADRIDALNVNLLKIETAGQSDLYDQQLKRVSPISFSALGKFNAHYAVFSINHKCGLITPSGKILIAPTYDTLLTDRNMIVGNLRQGRKDNWVLLDSLGNRKSSKDYESIRPFNGKYFTARNRAHWGALNLAGQEVIACAYDSLLQTRDDLIVVMFRGQYGIINIKEEWIVTPRANPLVLIGHERYLEKTTKTTFLKSLDGNVIYFSDNKLDIFSDHLLEHLPSGTLWKIDMEGRIADRQVHPDEPIENIFEESEGLRGIQKNGKFGFIDSQGRLRVANRYEGIQKFSEGLAAAKIRGHWGFISREDKIVIQPAYESVTEFENGLSFVKQNGRFGLIDKTGKQLLPTRYEEVKVLSTNNLLIKQNGLVGLADHNGKVIITPRYHHLIDCENGYAVVERDQKYGVVTLQGISTIPMIYDFIQYDHFNRDFLALKKATWIDIKN